jgi:formylglycine-generating enzyme required for sulfatase activity
LLALALLAPACSDRSVGAQDAGSTPDANPCLHPKVTRACALGFCTIPPGCFQMGSPGDEPCRFPRESQHPVQLTHEFQIQDREVTQTAYQQAMTYNPSYHTACSPTCPVDWLTWSEAVAYCNSLSTAQGLQTCYSCTGSGRNVFCSVAPAFTGAGAKIYDCKGYRLPTEAEWEYAYRAGTTTPLYNGVLSSTAACNTCSSKDPRADAVAWYCANASNTPHVGQAKQANAWGLYDMAGNVWEWVNDGYKLDLGSTRVVDPVGDESSTKRVMRGGSYSNEALYLRAAARSSSEPIRRNINTGFRCARTTR